MNKKLLIVLILIILIILFGVFIIQFNHSVESFDDLNQELEYIFSQFVETNKSIKNCVLKVMKGDGSFSWTGSAGVANQEGQIPMINDNPICIASITKLFTATVIMRLYEEGKLSLDDPMSKYLPDEIIRGIHLYKGQDYSYKITIKELLSHTSGIADYYTEKPKGGKSLFEIFLEKPEISWSVNDTIDRARNDLKPNFEPGTDASYSDTNFQLLGKIIESITGKQLHNIYEDYFFRPLELKHTWLNNYSEPPSPLKVSPADIFYKNKRITDIRYNKAYWADGGIISTAEECIIFLKALNEGKLIRKSTLRLMHDWHKLEFPIKYGYGTMYFKLPNFMTFGKDIPPLWGHSGSTGSFLYYSEDLDLYMAGTINLVGFNSKSFNLMIDVMNAVKLKN